MSSVTKKIPLTNQPSEPEKKQSLNGRIPNQNPKGNPKQTTKKSQKVRTSGMIGILKPI